MRSDVAYKVSYSEDDKELIRIGSLFFMIFLPISVHGFDERNKFLWIVS